MQEERKPYVINIDGNQTFSADFLYEQMAAQGCRIDRARRIAIAALVIAVAAVVVATVLAAELFL